MISPVDQATVAIIHRALDVIAASGTPGFGIQFEDGGGDADATGYIYITAEGIDIPKEQVRSLFLQQPPAPSEPLEPWMAGMDDKGICQLILVASDPQLWEAFRRDVLSASNPKKAGPDA